MDDYFNVFEGSHHHRHMPRDKYNFLYKQTKKEPTYRNRYDSDKYIVSQTTLDIHHHCKHNSKSMLSTPLHPRSSSKKSSYPVLDEDVASLPYYIVPVLYVPHKPLYEAKQMIEPKAYKAYHCKSKNKLHRETKFSPKLRDHDKKSKKEYDYPFTPKSERYSFETYDEYFRRCIEDKKSSSEISFYTEKSYCDLPLTPKMSSKFGEDAFVSSSERRRSISKDFPELFGVRESKMTDFTLRLRTGDEIPTWDSPRTADALVETEATAKSCISAQTSLDAFKWRREGICTKTECQGTQTAIMDVKKNVLVIPNENFKRPGRRQPVREGMPKDICDGDMLAQFSDGNLEKTKQKPFGFNKSNSRFTVSRMAKSAVSNSYSLSKRSSRKSVDSESTSIA